MQYAIIETNLQPTNQHVAVLLVVIVIMVTVTYFIAVSASDN